jgi:hypothetical protein
VTGKGGSVYKACSESLTTHVEVAGGYVKKKNGSCQGWPRDGRSKLLCCMWLSPFLKLV